jgi:hypothetical protein
MGYSLRLSLWAWWLRQLDAERIALPYPVVFAQPRSKPGGFCSDDGIASRNKTPIAAGPAVGVEENGALRPRMEPTQSARWHQRPTRRTIARETTVSNSSLILSSARPAD